MEKKDVDAKPASKKKIIVKIQKNAETPEKKDVTTEKKAPVVVADKKTEKKTAIKIDKKSPALAIKPIKLTLKPTNVEKKSPIKILAHKNSTKPDDLESSPKERAAVETKEDIRINLQVEKELQEAQNKFLSLSQEAEATKSQAKNTI